MNEILNITKAKVLDDIWMELEYSLTEADGDETVSTDIKSVNKRRIHDDLKEAYKKLVPHLALLSEIVQDGNFSNSDFNTQEIYSKTDFNKFKVTSFSLGGSDEHAGVTITGRMSLKGKKILDINTPFTKFEEQVGQENYKFLRFLYSDINHCIDEVEQYLNGKHAPNPQLELDIKC